MIQGQGIYGKSLYLLLNFVVNLSPKTWVLKLGIESCGLQFRTWKLQNSQNSLSLPLNVCHYSHLIPSASLP